MIGIDEVGRGAWAGPLLVVACRPISKLPQGLTDSKLLNKVQREAFIKSLITSCQFGEGWVSSDELDSLGLAAGLWLGVARALEELRVKKDEEIIIDGSINYCPAEFVLSRAVVKADTSQPAVSAASIYAKVTRDKFMGQLGRYHANYNFEANVGYGTKGHLQALQTLGPIVGVHRYSFRPVQNLKLSYA